MVDGLVPGVPLLLREAMLTGHPAAPQAAVLIQPLERRGSKLGSALLALQEGDRSLELWGQGVALPVSGFFLWPEGSDPGQPCPDVLGRENGDGASSPLTHTLN